MKKLLLTAPSPWIPWTSLLLHVPGCLSSSELYPLMSVPIPSPPVPVYHPPTLSGSYSSPASFPPSGDAYLCPGTKVSASASIIDPFLSLHTPQVKFSLSDSLSLKSPSPC